MKINFDEIIEKRRKYMFSAKGDDLIIAIINGTYDCEFAVVVPKFFEKEIKK